MSAGLTDTGFWQRFWNRLSGRADLASGERHTPFIEHTTPAGSTVTVDSALKLPAVMACVGLRAATVSSLPLNLLQHADKQVARGHPLQALLHDSPNADMTASEFWENQTAALDLWGNGFSRIERNFKRDKIVALVPLNSERMNVRRLPSGAIGYEFTRGGNVEQIDEKDVFHLKGFTLDGLVGLSRIQYAAESIGGLMDANKVARNDWKTGMKVGGFIKMPASSMSPEQRAQALARFGKFSDAENSGRWMPLEAGMEPWPVPGLRLSPIDAQLLQSRYFGIEEICRAFGIPPALIGHTDKASSWASSLESLNRAFLAYSLRPSLRRIEQSAVKKLLTAGERLDMTVKFNVKALMRADAAAQSAFYASALQNGYMNRDEVRDLEDEPPIPDGKGQAFTVQLNLTPVDQIGQQKPAAVAAPAMEGATQ